jgi:hypothetical protein
VENNIIWKLKYKKDPEITILTSTNILLFTILYIIGISSTFFSSYGSHGGIMLTIIFFPIISLILYWYSPVFKSISLYKTLDLYKDKIIINKTKEYPINQVSSSIKSVHRGHRLTSASWTSCIFTDNNKNTIGEFFFAIDTKEKILDATPEGLVQVINDLKLKKDYNFKNKLEMDYQKFLNDKKTYDLAIVILILVFAIPALIGLFFAIAT